MDIFVLHYTPLKERKAFILEQFVKEGMSAKFIETSDREVLTAEDLKRFDIEKLKMSEISCSMKHFDAYSAIQTDYALILEDDVILAEGFNTTLQTYISQLPNDFDMLFIGSGCNLHIPASITQNSGTNVFLKDNFPSKGGGAGATRCTDSYVITKKCAQKLLRLKNRNGPIQKPMGWWMNIMIRNHSMKVFWAEPTIVTQGSQTGVFQTTIQR